MEQNTPNREGRRELFYERSFTDAGRVNNSLVASSWMSAVEAGACSRWVASVQPGPMLTDKSLMYIFLPWPALRIPLTEMHC